MGCTTILVGKKATYDGSTMIARNDDSGAGYFTAKKFTVVSPKQQPKTYHSVLSHVTIELPENPMRYTACSGWKGRDCRRNRGRGSGLSGASLYQKRQRGRFTSWQPVGAIRDI